LDHIIKATIFCAFSFQDIAVMRLLKYFLLKKNKKKLKKETIPQMGDVFLIGFWFYTFVRNNLK
jgi:hypothetical protein